MKIDIKEADVESNITFGDTIEMGISQDGIQHLMSTLTNLYNDPQLAVIREYYTNGLDSHVEAGQTQPVDVYLPTRDNPMYVVRDYGIGMSVNDIKTIYSKYGASTKRNTNDQVGAYGLGCKSALTDAEQFTLTAVKDGIKVTAIIGKAASGANTIDILSPRNVDEGNGVTVTIPVKEVSSFNTKALDFFRFSDPSKVRINGHAPESVLANSDFLYTDSEGTKIYTQKNTGWRNPTFKVIMGDVPYEFSVDEAEQVVRRIKTKFDINQSKLSAYFVVPIGAVDLTPSREGLRYTDKTKALVDKVFGLYIEHIRAAAYAEIDATEKRHEVYGVITKWANILDKETTLWKGEKVLWEYMSPVEFKTVYRNGMDSTHSDTRHLNLRNKVTIVYGRETSRYKSVSMYLTPYMASKDTDHGNFYFIEDKAPLSSKWITENELIEFVHADTLVAEAKEQRKKDRAALKGQLVKSNKYAYIVMDIKNEGKLSAIPYDLIEEGTPYLNVSDFYRSLDKHYGNYFNGKRTLSAQGKIEHTTNKKVAAAFSKFSDADQVIIIGGTLKKSALESRVKLTYNILDDIKKTVQATFAHVPQNVRDIAALKNTNLNSLLTKIKTAGLEGEIKDRDVRRLINPKKKARLTYEKLMSYETNLSVIEPNSGKSGSQIPVHSDMVSNTSSKYPLLSVTSIYNLGNTELKHFITYMNAVHDESLTPTP